MPLAEGRATLDYNRLAGNKAAALTTTSADGGGLLLYANERVNLSDNIFQNNSATNYGGGLYIFNTPTFLTNTVFVANRAPTSGAGLLIEGGSTVHLRHTTFNDNGLAGTDIYIRDDPYSPGSGPFSRVWLTNTILASYTTGISVTAGNTLTVNSMLWLNTPITIDTAAATISVSNLFSGNPAFAADGYHLTAGSAARGRGFPAGVQTDIDGDLRGTVPDLGADEYDASLPGLLYLPLIMKEHQITFSRQIPRRKRKFFS